MVSDCILRIEERENDINFFRGRGFDILFFNRFYIYLVLREFYCGVFYVLFIYN